MAKDSPTPTLPQKERGQSFLPPDGTTSHSTKLSKDDNQVAGYAGEGRETPALAQQLGDALAKQLGSTEAAGSYTLDCSVETLRSATEAAGFALFDTDLKGIKGKQNLLNALAVAAQFPPDFGANWDALADALCDLSWHESNGYVLLLRNVSDTLGLSANDREIALDIFADTAVYWRQHNKAFWIFFA